MRTYVMTALRSAMGRCRSALRTAEIFDMVGETKNGVDEALSRLRALDERLTRVEATADLTRHFSETGREIAQMIARRKIPRSRARVLFLIHHRDALYSQVPVIEAMRDDPDFDVIVASIDHCYPSDAEARYAGEAEVHQALTHFGIDHLRFASQSRWDDLMWIRTLDPDIIFRQSQWEPDIEAPFRTFEVRSARLALIPYEMANLVDNPREPGAAHSAVDNYFHKNAWAVFCVSEEWRDTWAAAEAPATGARQFYGTGHPKVQALRERLRQSSTSERPFTVLWSAHHSIDDEWINFGTYPDTAPLMIELAHAHPEWEFIFSAHPALIAKLEERPQLRDLRERWDELPNTRYFAGGGDYAAVFNDSDVLVCDGVSWLMEYQLTAKPVVFIERAHHAPFNDFGRVVREGTNVVTTGKELTTILEHVAAGGTDPAAQGQQRVRELLRVDHDAVAEIVATIKTKLREEGWHPTSTSTP
ncbi:hypothetical protein H8R18_00105 [Nanchangia anserum]|uniref:Uncharacterized protein n=1 Tax=Nanchangia anserum TaxID=2692125 RepID=A0A8I0GF16_9ACTO|nr:hypothetical protein [Nanchangia anserum]MBD3689652.1 hypothetical protein [Nanchangia anserum]QOX81833.1 hypothetical protein H8R18_00105 [Nanchangia anserum]